MNNIDKSRVIFHIDVDSFFVSAELTIRQEYKNSDIAISIGNENSIVSSLSYSAKAKGAKVPMKLKEVRQYCPDIIIFNPNFDLYSKISNNLYEYLKNTYTDQIEIGSIDEWFLDMTDVWKKYNDVICLAKQIQKDIKNKFKLDVSIGISYNKFLAKMSTDLNKPIGISLTRYEDIKKNIWPLSIKDYWGIGKSLQNELEIENIRTIGDLANSSKLNKNLKKIFLNQIDEYIDNANGFGDNKINKSNSFLKTINNSRVFYDGPSNDLYSINNLIKEVSILVSQRLNERSLVGNKILIQIKQGKKINQSISRTLPTAISDINSIYENALNLFHSIWEGQEISGIGIQVYSLKNAYQFQWESSLFEINEINNNDTTNAKVLNVINELNNKNNKKILYTAKEFSQNKTIKKSQSKYIK